MGNVRYRAMLPDVQLAVRQARISAGLRAVGTSWDEIRALNWYDARLEPLVTREAVDRYHTPNHPHVDLSEMIVDGMDLNPDPDDVRHGGDQESNKSNAESNSAGFDKKAYQRDLMRKRRAEKKV